MSWAGLLAGAFFCWCTLMVSKPLRWTRNCAPRSRVITWSRAWAACAWLAAAAAAPALACAAAIRSPWISRSVVAEPPGCDTNSAAWSSWSSVTSPSGASSMLISPSQKAATSRSSAIC